MSATSNSYPLADAQRIARALTAELSGACVRLEVAGSLRRLKPQVNDIELVAIPEIREEVGPGQAGLFAAPERLRVNRLWEAIEAASVGHSAIVPIKPGAPGLQPDLRWPEKRLAGSRYFKLWLPRTGIGVDLFMPQDARSWGLILAIRTGSAEFSAALVKRWTAVSGGGHAQDGLLRDRTGAVVATQEEEDVFRACRARWIEPRRRRGAHDLQATT